MWRWLWTLTLTLALGRWAVACGISPPITEQVEATADELVVIEGSSCASLLAGQTIVAGTVCAVVDGNDLVLTYQTTGDWRLYEAHLCAGLSILDMP